MGDEGKVHYTVSASSWLLKTEAHAWDIDSLDTRPANASQPGCIQALDSLDMEGNMGTKWDALSSRVCPVDGHLDDEAIHWLDIQGESCLGCTDDIWSIS